MSEKSLARIEKVLSVYPVEGADNVEMCQIQDYHILVKKSEKIQKNDLVIYVEIDSILPDGLSKSDLVLLEEATKRAKKATGDDLKALQEEIARLTSQNTFPEFEFLRQKKFRIKAWKLSKFGIISMGIVFPLSILQTVPKVLGKEFNQEFKEGLDVTDFLGIQKVVEDLEEIDKSETETNSNKLEKILDRHLMKYSIYRKYKKEIFGERIKGSWLDIFPSQSDETPAQKCYTKFIETNGRTGYYKTSKIEGQNYSSYLFQTSRFFNIFKKDHFGICTHHRNLITDDGSQFWKTAKELDLEKRMKSIGKNLLIRGEHAGGKIQGNIYKLSEHHVYLFEVWDISKKRFYTFDEFMEFCRKYEFEHVPVIDDNYTLPETVQEILQESNRFDELVPGVKVQGEGIVVRLKDDITKSFKVRSPEYLLLHGK